MIKFSKEQLIQRAFERLAMVMHGMWEEKEGSDTRLLNPPLIPDEYVVVGESTEGKEYREHVVPRSVICYECNKMFKNGESICSVARFIRDYLKIVYIATSEQQKLDSGDQLNLRQSMPEGWSFGDDIYARLKMAEIDIKFYESVTNT